MSNDQISINNLSKVFDNGFEALKNINLKQILIHCNNINCLYICFTHVKRSNKYK